MSRSSATDRNGPATLAFVCGAIAFALSFAQPETTETSHGFLASTVGITAIASGLRALALVRSGEASSAMAAVLGIVGGAIGTVVMGAFLISFYFAPGSTTSSGAPSADAREVEATAASPSAPAVSADLQAERMALAQAAATISFVLSNTATDATWPEALTVGSDGVIRAPSGIALATIPIGTQLIYATSSDRTQYAVTLVGPSFGASATFDSAVGQVAVG